MANLGLTPADYEQTFEIWPENMPAALLYMKVRGQWRMGSEGPVGLDHNVLFKHLDRMKPSDEEWDELFSLVGVMEHESLICIAEAQDEAREEAKRKS